MGLLWSPSGRPDKRLQVTLNQKVLILVRYWVVFKINAKTGQLTIINQLQDTDPFSLSMSKPNNPMNFLFLGVILTVSCITVGIVTAIVVYGRRNPTPVAGGYDEEKSPLVIGLFIPIIDTDFTPKVAMILLMGLAS